MAAALIPLIPAIVPTVMPLLAKLMDKVFGKGTGKLKLVAGTALGQTLMTVLQKELEGTGISLPTSAAEIQALLQSTVDDLNAKGLLKGAATSLDATAPIPGSLGLAAMLLETAAALIRSEKP